MTTQVIGAATSFDVSQGLLRDSSQQPSTVMSVSVPLISNMSNFIFSYVLVQAGVTQPLPPNAAITCVLAGTLGFVAYFALEWSSERRQPATTA